MLAEFGKTISGDSRRDQAELFLEGILDDIHSVLGRLRGEADSQTAIERQMMRMVCSPGQYGGVQAKERLVLNIGDRRESLTHVAAETAALRQKLVEALRRYYPRRAAKLLVRLRPPPVAVPPPPRPWHWREGEFDGVAALSSLSVACDRAREDARVCLISMLAVVAFLLGKAGER